MQAKLYRAHTNLRFVKVPMIDQSYGLMQTDPLYLPHKLLALRGAPKVLLKVKLVTGRVLKAY